MKKVVGVFAFLYVLGIQAQEMNPTRLGKILHEVSDSIISTKPQWRFKIKEVAFICIADSTHNRMRVISPIAPVDKLTNTLKTAALTANFHTALDVKYAISDEILWSVFIHPLKELTKKQVLDAISQVYYANINFGTTFSSTSLVFPGRKPKPKPKPIPKKIRRI